MIGVLVGTVLANSVVVCGLVGLVAVVEVAQSAVLAFVVLRLSLHLSRGSITAQSYKIPLPLSLEFVIHASHEPRLCLRQATACTSEPKSPGVSL